MSERLRVGFAGIGAMGAPMASNLLAAGFPLTVYNRTAERCQPLVEGGAQLAADPASLAAADVVVTMLADGAAVRRVLCGEAGVLAAAAPGLVVLEMSTVGPVAARELAAAARERGVELLDAPVSGSVSVAAAAQLTTVVGGEYAAFERALPVLQAMTRAQFHLGDSGAGAAMKLALNVIVASTAHATAEALVLAESAGIERSSAYEVLLASAVASPFIAYKQAAFLDPDREPPAFALDLMRKDLDLARELGGRVRMPMLAAAAASEAMTLAAGLEGGGEDLVRVADALRRVSSGE